MREIARAEGRAHRRRIREALLVAPGRDGRAVREALISLATEHTRSLSAALRDEMTARAIRFAWRSTDATVESSHALDAALAQRAADPDRSGS
jgi:hypothetical protein